MNKNENFIQCQTVYFEYEDNENEVGRIALNGVDLDIDKGEFIAILGHNGSGKSTLAKHFNALLVPSEGTIYVDGMDTAKEENLWNIRSSAGMVFQNPDNQLVATIVEEDVAFGPENLGIESKEIIKRVDESLKKVGMYKYKNHAPHLLSGGQKQRVAIAGILAMRTKCIILDEPTAMLDPLGRKEVIETIKNINRQYGITIILITHYMEEAAEANRIVVMDNGHVVMQGNPKEVFSKVSEMKNLGLDVPQVTELAYLLNKNGIKIRTDLINIDEMVDALCQLE